MKRYIGTTVLAALPMVFASGAIAEKPAAPRGDTLLRTDGSWNGHPYKTYPAGQPELTVLKLTIPPHTKLPWHSHPVARRGGWR